MKIKKTDAEKLLNEYRDWCNTRGVSMNHAGRIKHFVYGKFSNCLEAKPKALNSMQEAKKICTACGSTEISWYGNDDDKTFFCFGCKKVQND